MIFGWALVLLAPGDTLQWSPAFAPLLRRASESTWGIGLLVLGIARFAALIINGRMPAGSPVIRGTAALLSAVVWSQMLYGALDVSIREGIVLPGVAINLILLGCEMVTVTRSTIDFMRRAKRVVG